MGIYLSRALMVSAVLFSNVAFGQSEEISTLLVSGHVHSEHEGMCPFGVSLNPAGPVAIYGLHKRKDKPTEYGYLILFEPKPDRESAVKTEKVVKGTNTTETRTDSHQQFKWEDKMVEVQWKFDASKKIEKLVINSNDFTGIKNRVFFAKEDGNQITIVPVKTELPTSVPNVTKNERWNEAVAKAIDQLKAASHEVKKFYR